MAFEPGDIVQLKSGSPLMTVEQVGEKSMTGEPGVWCVWSETVGAKTTVKREVFNPIALDKAEKPKPFTRGGPARA